jgi:sec-independent protein translocase protein TatA
MPNVGPFELAIVLVIALIVFGPKRLPELGKSVGRGIREFKGSLSGENDDDEATSPAKIESAQPPPPPSESAEPAKTGEGAEAGKADETVVHDRG